MERESVKRRPHTGHRVDERGFTLVEMLISLVLVAGITGAIATSLITSLRAHETSSHRINESNDAQFISAFLVRDAQAAGGSNPATGAVDPSLGVSLTDPAGCIMGSGTLVARFRWIDRSVAASPSLVATYYTAGNLLTRQLCTNGAVTAATTLGRNVASASASCNPSIACPGMPGTVELVVTETNTPQVAPTAFSYTLRASVRPEAQSPPTGATAQVVPLLALGTGVCGGAPVLDISGNPVLRVNGAAIVNSACPGALSISGSTGYSATGGTSIPLGGTCTGNQCGQSSPLTNFAQPIPDPLAGLPPLPNSGCSGSGNPAQVGGRYQPGTYHNSLTLGSGLSQFDPGVYVFCAGLTVSAQADVVAVNVLLYIAGGAFRVNGGASLQMSPPASGDYTNLVVWQPTSNTTPMTINGSAAIENNFGGIIYVPRADVTLSGTSGSLITSLIAQRIIVTGTQDSIVGSEPLAVATPSLPGASVGVAYSATVSATGGTIPYAWAASGLPAGLSISAAGLITGTPSAAGSSTVIVTVTDGAGATATRTYSLTVGAAALTVSGPASLANGAINVAYPATQMTANGGTAPYTWAATGLPTGLNMNAAGVLAGTPTVTGTFPVTVTVTDAASATSSRNYSLVIPPVPTNVVLANGGGATLGRADRGDTIVVTFSEPMATASFCAGWNGSTLNGNDQVTVTIADGGTTDTLAVTVSTCTFNLGTIALNANYVATGRTFGGSGAQANRSSIAWNAAARQLTITLGTASGTTNSGVPASTPGYTPSGLVTSTAGVGIVTTLFAAPGTSRF